MNLIAKTVLQTSEEQMLLFLESSCCNKAIAALGSDNICSHLNTFLASAKHIRAKQRFNVSYA